MRESMIRLLVAAAAVLVAVIFMSAAVALSRPPVHIDVAPAGPPPPATFTITGHCTVTATHDGQTVTHHLDGQTTVELATPGSITAPGCTIQ